METHAKNEGKRMKIYGNCRSLKNLLCTIFAAEQRGNKLIYLIDEKLEETGKSLSLACGIHTNDPPMFPPLWSKLGKSEKSTDCPLLVLHTLFESGIYRVKDIILPN